jgi:hypothetical protein
MAPELLPPVDIREVHFDDGDGDSGDGISERERVVGKGARIHDDGLEPLASRALNPVHELAFMIGLAAHRLRPAALRVTLNLAIELSQRGAPIHGRLACTQEIQIGPVKDEDARGRRTCHAAESIH